MKATDDEVTAAIRRCGGNLAAAARHLGAARSTVQMCIGRSPHLWPSELPRFEHVAPEAVTAALAATEGHIAEAASLVGRRPDAVVARLRHGTADWPEGTPRPRKRALRPSERQRTTEALRAAGGELVAAAEALGIPYGTLRARLNRHPELWPEGIDRRTGASLSAARAERLETQRAEREALKRARAAETREAILVAEGNLAAAARLLGITRQAMHQRAAGLAEMDSPAHPTATTTPEGAAE